MANAKLKCKCHGEYQPRENLIINPKGKFCSFDLMMEWANEQTTIRINKAARKAKTVVNKKVKAQKVKDKAKKKELITRSEWYQKLQRVVNQYITKVRDKDKACCSCGTCGDHLKYDAGHYIAVGSNMDLRFELTNIHLQCSVKCNVFGRGMPVEYGEFIKAVYGEGHYNWLHTNFLCHKPHPTLKEQFPTVPDIELEIKRYRELISRS
ncbi:MAG TPA: hypothetical protein EYN54_11320 [Methylococcaceae bacterium]|nr:hypothetical protein [Methylococcaceae bacterium]